MKYDVVIAGSGLGGLLCATILSKEGYSVCIIEKNPKLGGCLQSMRRSGCVFNTGVHYMGSLDEGQVLYQYFKYFGLIGNIDLRRLDATGFEAIGFDDGTEYRIGMGENFIGSLSSHFPDEYHHLKQYEAKLREVCNALPFYSFDDSLQGAVFEKPYIGCNAEKYVCSLIKNPTLQQVLFGNDLMYGSISSQTSLLQYALINHSVKESAWRMAGDSEQISRALASNIRASGGHIILNRTVEGFRFENGKVVAAKLHTGEEIAGKQFISALHPQNTMQMVDTALFRRSYVRKIEDLKNTSGFFVLHVVLKEQSFPYYDYNYYHHSAGSVWPQKYLMVPMGAEQNGFAQGVSLMAIMDYDEVKQWENTTVGHRGADYLDFKSRKAEQLLDTVGRKFPGFRQSVASWHATTPLSYRDYTGTPQGSAYGIVRDCTRPLSTMMFPRTGIENFLLTGQNVYFHGVLGVSIGAIATCSELLGTKFLMDKIR